MLLVETAVIGGLFLLYPRISRRGLLFGVYVGEECWDGTEARRIMRGWQIGIALWSVASLGIAVALFLRFHKPLVASVAPLLLTGGYLLLFLRTYFRARALAAPGSPPPAVAVLDVRQGSLWPAILVLVIGIMGGIVAMSYAAMHYADLPVRIPTHFGPSGAPDAWRPKTLWTVMLLPLLTLVLGIGMGGIVILTARAKRAVRFPQTQISIEAQTRFRQAITWFLGCMSVVVTAMLTLMSVSSIRVGLGLAARLSPVGMALAIGLVAFALGGTLYLALRYGQGGARLERGAGNAPLTDGLADNRHWVLGSFYVNRNDPSIFVERRFGFGYTINFGNPKAVFLLLLFLGALVAIAVMARLKG